ncbi:MAG: hypothetical protein Q9216_003011 [Gyalolechia sp. 2 TL-2023]
MKKVAFALVAVFFERAAEMEGSVKNVFTVKDNGEYSVLEMFLERSVVMEECINTTYFPRAIRSKDAKIRAWLRINCFIQPPPSIKRLPRADVTDCYSALQALLLGDKAMAPMHFTEDDQRGFKVPFAWGHDSCQIVINNITPHAEATFPIVLIAHLAAEIAEACIVGTPANLGGDVKLGAHGQFEVIVAGTGLTNGRLKVADGNRSDDVTSETMPRVIEDSDEDENNDNSPIRPPKPALERSPALAVNELYNPLQASLRVSAGPSTTSTEALSRDIQDAYSHLLESSTSRSSRSSHLSSGSPLASKRRVTTDFEFGGVKKTKVTYGARKSRDDFHLGALSEDEEPVKMRKRVRISKDAEEDLNEVWGKDEDQSSGSTFQNVAGRHDSSTQPSTSDCGRAPDASMPPPASRTPRSSRQLVQSSNGSTFPCTERASCPPSAADDSPNIPAGEDDDSRSELLSVGSPGRTTLSNSRTRKRSVSDLESPKILLGEELPPSSSAPTESPTKRARIDCTYQRDTSSKSRSGLGEDELSLPATGFPRSKGKRAKSRDDESKTPLTRACQTEELGSDDLVSDLPKENYQPRPSRSRFALAVDDLVIPEDFSKRPEALAKSKKTSKRRNTTAFEEGSRAVEPTAMQHRDSDLQAHIKQVLASTSEPVKESSPQLSPPRKKSRGRPKKDAAPQEQPTALPVEPLASGKKHTGLDSVSLDKQADTAPTPAKRGRKRKKSAAKGDENLAEDILPKNKPLLQDKEREPVTGPALAESDPNIQPSTLFEDHLSVPEEDIKQTISSNTEQIEQPLDKSPNDSSSPLKLKAEEQKGTPKASVSAKQESKTIYRVGLSKRQRIPSLLRIVKK